MFIRLATGLLITFCNDNEHSNLHSIDRLQDHPSYRVSNVFAFYKLTWAFIKELHALTNLFFSFLLLSV